MSWDVDKLGDLAETRLGKRLHRAGNKGDYYPYLGNDNIQWGELKLDIIKEIRLTPGELERYRVRNGDLLVCEGGDPGRCAIWNRDEEMYCQMALHRVRPDENKLSALWLKYYLMSLKLTGALDQYVTARTTIKHIPQPALRAMPVRHPDIETQRRIASILMAYDNLIENNRKQIALLEEAAQRLYKEWFIDLRFPGHEDAEIVDGVPQGWQKQPLANCIDEEIGGGWGQECSSHEFSEIGYVVRATDMLDVESGSLASVPLRWHKASNMAPRALEAGDIIFEVSGGSREHGVGRSMLVTQEVLDAFGKPVMCASFCKRIKPKQGMSLFLAECISYEYRAEGLRRFEKRSAGNIINYHWKSFLSEYSVLIPDGETLDTFRRRIRLIRDMRSLAARDVRLAREARDRLLPRLMSGEIEV